MPKEFAVSARGDQRFRPERHFIRTDVTKPFLKRYGIKMTIAEFKRFLDSVRPEFIAHAGNLRIATAAVKVYDIQRIQKRLSGYVQCSFEGIR